MKDYSYFDIYMQKTVAVHFTWQNGKFQAVIKKKMKNLLTACHVHVGCYIIHKPSTKENEV